MICIYFWAGTFGSTVEYVVRSFTNEYTPIDTTVEMPKDGSMHGFSKLNHLTSFSDITNFLNNNTLLDDTILTPIYPCTDGTPLSTTVSLLQSYNAQSILIYVNSIEYAELTRLFQYHKIIDGSIYKMPDKVFGNFKSSISRWDPQYQHVSDLQAWEFREWQSLENYSNIMLDAPNQVNSNFLKISTEEILNNTVATFEKIISWCKLSRSSADLEKFAVEWRQRQQYVLDEHKLIINIVNATINNVYMLIPKDLNIIAQSIIQQRLRNAGYELRCDGLNEFPEDTKLLHNLLDRDLTLHQGVI